MNVGERINNNWKCPKCEKIVDYGESKPTKGNTFCAKTGENVQMKQIKELPHE